MFRFAFFVLSVKKSNHIRTKLSLSSLNSGVATRGARGCNAPSVNGFAPPVKFLIGNERPLLCLHHKMLWWWPQRILSSCNREKRNFSFLQPSRAWPPSAAKPLRLAIRIISSWEFDRTGASSKNFVSWKWSFFNKELLFRLKKTCFLLWVVDKQLHHRCKMNIFDIFESSKVFGIFLKVQLFLGKWGWEIISLTISNWETSFNWLPRLIFFLKSSIFGKSLPVWSLLVAQVLRNFVSFTGRYFFPKLRRAKISKTYEFYEWMEETTHLSLWKSILTKF